jgi:integrase
MAAQELMTWSKSQKRWLKKYRGRMYSVSPRQLETPRSRQSSRQAANEWWLRKRTQIDAQALPEHPEHLVNYYDHAIENHSRFAQWHRLFGNAKVAEKSERHAESLQQALKTLHPPFPLGRWEEDPLWEAWRDETGFAMWQERFRQLHRAERQEHIAPENTVRAHIDDHLNDRKAAQRQGKIRSGTYQTYFHRLNVFKDWVEPGAPLEDLNEQLLRKYYHYLVGQVAGDEMSASYASACLGVAKKFIRSRWELRLIELPRNLGSRDLVISVDLQEPEIFDPEEMRRLLDAASDRMRLFILLALNCGMYSVDIGSLRPEEVDWNVGRIARKRTKTKGRSKKVPTVNYRLWNETFRLLRGHRSDSSELVLTNEDGGPLWWEGESARTGKYTRNDNVKTLFFRLWEELEVPQEERKPFKTWRKTGSTKLEEHDVYGRYTEYYLGEAPSSITRKHYVVPSGEQFDKALRWLGRQFGFETAR